MSRDFGRVASTAFRVTIGNKKLKKKRSEKKKKETEGGCPRLVHAVQRFVLYLWKHMATFPDSFVSGFLFCTTGNLTTVVFLLPTLLQDLFAHEKRTTIPLDYSLTAQAASTRSVVCDCVGKCVRVYPSILQTAYIGLRDVCTGMVYKQHLEIIMDRLRK